MTSIAQKASTSNSSQSNSTSKWNFEVFLSFRGEDTRKGFTSHLYAALCREGIKTFMDDEELERGEVISEKLCEAIKNSLYAIVVLSKDYASSSWCLNELEMILASKELGQVLPIFYNVDPSHVRHQKGSFNDAFTEHEEKYKDDQEKVKKWRESLTQVANLSGWDSRNWSEAQLIDTVVDELWRKLHSKFPSYNAKLVGIDSRLDAIYSLLKIEMNDVRFLGIWGMGGIGKTTLSRVVYGRLSKQFEISCYLDNIRDISESGGGGGGGGHVFLQQQLLSHFNVKGKMIENPEIGKERIRSLFNNKKVLLVLDDISSRDQLENLAGSRDWFGEGSRVIITTRNKHLLMSLGDHEIYEVQILNKEESLQLFSRNAFRSDKPKEDYLELCTFVVKYTGGLPLALQVLGSFLCGRGKPEWEETLDKITQGSEKEIDKILRISYEGLEDSQKIVFLDIACFFKLWRKDEVIEILKNCGLHPRIDMRVLIEKSLVTEVCIGDRMHLDMHDLVQQMGRSIVIQESPNASKRSRLWSPKDIHQVLKRNMGTELTHGVVLPKSYDVEAHWHPEAFLKMINLRLLIISYDLYLPNGLKCLSSALKVLHWYKYPLEALPLGTPLDELVYLKMHHSKVKQLWIGRQCLENLEHMDLSYSKFLIATPDFSEAPNLKTLILENCTNLVEIHQSLGLLKNLLVVNLKGCINLKFLPKKVEMNSLKEFVLHGCTQVRNLPEFGENMKNLGIIDLEETGTAKLPESLGFLIGLEVLNLRGCKNLVFLPHTIVNLKHLKLLDISGCSKFSRLPENLNEVEALEKLDASETAIIEIPSSIGHLQRLEKLLLSGCFFQVRHPSHKVLLPPSFGNLKSLTELNLSYNNIDDGDILDCLSSLSSLRKLNLSGNKFENLPAGCICNLLQLQFLYLTFCSKLQSLPQPSPSLLRIDAAACASMKALSDEQLWNLFASIEKNGLQDTGIGLRTSSFIEHFVVNFPGSEIPSWFVDQFEFFETSESEANSIIIDIPQSCCTREWLGFALCQILDKESDVAFHGWTLDLIKAVEGCKLERTSRFKVLLDAHINPPLLGIMFVKFYKKNLPKSLIDYNKLCLTYFSFKDMGLVKCGWRVILQEDFELWAQSRHENDLSISEELKDRKCKRPLQLFPYKHRQGVFNEDRIMRKGMKHMRASRSMVQARQEYSPEIDQYFQLLRELTDEIIMIAHRNFDSLISHINYLESIFQNLGEGSMAENQSTGSATSGNGTNAATVPESNYRKDPLYLHPSDSSGVQLIPILLTQENYLIWSRSMTIALKTKNKLGFVDGTFKQPEDRTSEAYMSWSFVDSAVTGWLLHSMIKEIHEAYMFTPTARQIWLELEEKYGQSNRPQIFHLKKQLAALVRGCDNLAAYSTKLKKLWDELHCLQPKPSGCILCSGCECGSFKKIETMHATDHVDQLLMGLGEAYENIVDNILLMDPIPSYNKVYAMIARIERQRSVSITSSVEASALLARVNEQQKNAVASNAKGFDRKKEKASRYCIHCSKTGHTEETCFKKNGYPEWFKELKKGKKPNDAVNVSFNDDNAGQKQKDSDGERKLMAELIQEELKRFMKGKGTAEESKSTPLNASYFADFSGNLVSVHSDYFDMNDSEVKWIIDSGASSHVTGNIDLLIEIKKPSGRNTVQLPDGKVKIVELVGKVVLIEGLVLENVLFVPDFKYNLISVSKLAMNSGVQVNFHRLGCEMQDHHTKKLLAQGILVKNLYLLKKEETGQNKALVCKDTENSSVMWHSRLGHPSDNVLSHIGISNSRCNNETCNTCHLAKQTRISFPISESNTLASFEILHVHIWGPYGVPSLSGASFMLTIVDDFSGGVWIYLMHSKTQVTSLLSNFFSYVKNHFNASIKFVRTNNGLEFLG